MFDELKEYTIFFKNGNIMKVNACNCKWYDDSIDFYLTKEDYENEDNACTMFMSEYIYAVAESKIIEYDKSTLFPVESTIVANKTQDLIDQYNELFVKSNAGIRSDKI